MESRQSRSGWQTGEPCGGCGCQAVIDSPIGQLRAHLADCPRLDVNRAVEALREARAFLDTRHGSDGKLRRPRHLIERIDGIVGGQ